MTAGLLLAFLGYLLIYAGIKGVHPWAPVVEAFGGRAPAPPGSRSGSPESAATPTREAGAGVTTTGEGGLTRAANRCKEAIEQTYPELEYLGGPSCRKIIPHDGGTSDQWSEHAWGNAIDFGGPAWAQRKLVVWANLPHNKLRYQIANVIPAGSAVNAVHIDFFPSHTGQTPPCAGGR
jgi:hypothetical protein